MGNPVFLQKLYHIDSLRRAAFQGFGKAGGAGAHADFSGFSLIALADADGWKIRAELSGFRKAVQGMNQRAVAGGA